MVHSLTGISQYTIHLCWIKGPYDKACFAWPPRSPDLTPCDFYLWGFIKGCVYVLQLPADLPDLRHRLEAAVARITSDKLNKVWDEFAYPLDVCPIDEFRCFGGRGWDFHLVPGAKYARKALENITARFFQSVWSWRHTRAIGDGLRYFKKRSSDEDDIRAGTSSSNIGATPTGGL
ncbi:uncharacterized protein TNCV_3791181 [Trichonephila clavipes]|nr:uncharacterized protein TNCV_3791181 [Trichonephila clavipes]